MNNGDQIKKIVNKINSHYRFKVVKIELAKVNKLYIARIISIVDGSTRAMQMTSSKSITEALYRLDDVL